MWSDKVEYGTAADVHCTTHDFKVPFCMPEFSISKIIDHRLHVNNNKGKSGIGYEMIIGHDLTVQLDLVDYFKHKVLQWDGNTVHIKEPRGMLGKYDLNRCEMLKVVIQTVELNSTREATDQIDKILKSNYAKSEIKQVADTASHLNDEEITQLFNFLEDFKYSKSLKSSRRLNN